MAKKLTEEEKAANKAASKERTQAFKARRAAYESEQTAAEDAAKKLPSFDEKVAAQQVFENAMAQRQSALGDIDKEIARLQAQREEVRRQHDVVVDAAKAERSLRFDAHADATRQLTDAVKERYPDMVGCWYVAQWQRPEGV